ncbi:hypothetical protein Tco_1138251, partial [Tanacetum coccineum]
FDLKGYLDSDYVGCNMDRKSTSAKAEYVAAAGCCANILWMKSQLTDYDIIYEKCPSEIYDDLMALDSIVLFGFSDRRLELTATFSISTNSE